MWGSCIGLKRAIFWPFLGEVATGYTRQCEILHGTPLGTLIKTQEEPILRTMWGQCFGHKGPYFGCFVERGLQNKPTNVEFCMEYPWVQWLRFRKNQLGGPCFGHKQAMFWPFLGKGTKGFSQQSEIWHGASLGTLIVIQENKFEGPCEDNVLAIKGHILAIPRKGGYRIKQLMSHLAWNIPRHND